MANVHERIKELRNQLHLSQDYVAKYLEISRSTYAQIEDGKCKVLVDEVTQLSNLFGVSTNNLLDNTKLNQSTTVLTKSFEKDQEEIMNLIRLKEQIKTQRQMLQDL